jgi:AraC-like DNA-binding protein
MTGPSALERLPMTLGYFRLIQRFFGDTEERRAALLQGTGVDENDLRDPAADISVFQQVRQIENATRLLGRGWAISKPDVWNLPAHGALAVAVLSAPTLAESLQVLQRYGHVRSPWFRIELRHRRDVIDIVFLLTVALDEEQWRPMMEIAFLAIYWMIGGVLGRPPTGIGFRFACPIPDYGMDMGAALPGKLAFDVQSNAVSIPTAWQSVPSAHADASLFARAIAELQEVFERLEQPTNLLAQVERLLRTMPNGRLNALSVAQVLGVSRRTLARRLNDADANFRALLDAELKHRAEQMLKSRTLSRPDMAERLGYRDPTSFSRACRRWFADERRR